MNDTSTNQNRPSRKGNLNPMANRHHTAQSRQKMSQSHLAYQKRIRDAMQQQQSPMTMDEFLSNNPTLDIKGYIQSLVKEGVLDVIITEQIKKLK